MKVRIGTQLAAGFAVPVAALVGVSTAVCLGFGSLHASKQDVLAKTRLEATVHSIDANITRARHSARGYVVAGKNVEVKETYAFLDDAEADVAKLRRDAHLVPGLAEHVDVLAEQVKS